jgi:hypothetical protein
VTQRSPAAAARPRRAAVRGALGAACLLAGSVAFGSGVAEVAARVALRGDPESVSARYTEADPVRGWRHKPGARARFGAADIVINAAGLRDVDHAVQADPGVRRLLVLGDSFAEGFSVDVEDGVPRALERELRGRECPAEVIGGGTVGYSTDQEYLFYRDEGAAYGAATVVLLFYYNDVHANACGSVAGAPKPLFTFVGGRARVKNYPLPAAAPPAQARPAAGSAALSWARARLRDGAPRAHDALARLGLWPPVEPGELPIEMAVYLRDPPEPAVQAWLQTEHLLRLLAGETARNGAALVIAYIPSKMEVAERDWAVTRNRYRLDEREFDRGRVARLLARTGRALGVPVLDLTGALRAADGGPGRGPYFDRGGHWNARGHAVAAGAIAAALDRTGTSPCRPAGPSVLAARASR